MNLQISEYPTVYNRATKTSHKRHVFFFIFCLNWDISLGHLLPSYSKPCCEPPYRPRDCSRPWARGSFEQGPSTQPRHHGAQDAVIPDSGANPALQAREDEAQQSRGISQPAASLTGCVEDPVDSELERLAGLGGMDTIEDSPGATDSGSGEVSNAGAEAKIVAPRATLEGGLLLEEELGRGGEVIDAWVHRDGVGVVKGLIGVVELVEPSLPVVSDTGVGSSK